MTLTLPEAAAPGTVTQLPLGRAINTALRAAMTEDPKVILLGEDIGRLGGVFRVTDGLQREFGEERVLDTPLAESAIIGTAIGLALRGFRPVAEIQFDGFVFPGYDQIVTQLAKLHQRSAGTITLPVVVRIPYGGGIGAVEHHSESPEALFAHVAGVRVMAPATPGDAHWMLRQAIRGADPVIFFEPKRRYYETGPVDPAGPDVGPYSARVVRRGRDVTVAAYGPMVRTCLEAAEVAGPAGIDLEVLDLRSISPLDFDTVADSVGRTGRLVVAHEAPVFFGAGAEIAARITERCFHRLQAPVLRVGGFHTPYPPARLEHGYLPDADRVLDAVERALAY
ncbi:alpha-ketoacid dehydrogenase subunit beta [Dactylosporangium aurantiacum]|uniref:Alpha-ketoacid dehydrogenase subunit beta n=1 Tax=Dactylosporangium aurantiacum TaxID=35754 RepID=A0A9Q9MDV9_9ACTN|nr:alpha-ketoacid dehydrogenase subunit beta [Dactylosporangium aurantiacum]MDG6106912.1 alpha-ketoacid dehydrogenase subunit beta [Dactylosporangium aurantiacum]UWZ50725.1 alpha-ketoacid dehydrogenase subunit beta [Dactylosporangium aurantiacum]